MAHLDTASTIVIASAFGDAAQAVIAAANPFQDTIQKVIDLIDGAKVGIVTIIILVAALTAAFTRGHKGEILAGALFSCALVLGAKAIATALGA